MYAYGGVVRGSGYHRYADVNRSRYMQLGFEITYVNYRKDFLYFRTVIVKGIEYSQKAV